MTAPGNMWMTYGEGWPVWAQRCVSHGHDDEDDLVPGCQACDAADVLHVVAEAESDDGCDWWTRGDGTTVCGLPRASLAWPGVCDRLAAPRCPACCQAVGIPAGDGHPKNDPECRRLLRYDTPEATP